MRKQEQYQASSVKIFPVGSWRLVEVRRQPERKSLLLTWSDGHIAEYPYRYLRGWCPCAVCQGHGGGPPRYREPVERELDLLSVEPVGNYALAFRFSDGHGSGIYRFDDLRALCPCSSCKGS